MVNPPASASPADAAEAQAPAASAQPSPHSITVVNLQLNIRLFTISNDANDTAVRWAKWKKDIERQFRFFGLTDPELKKDGLIIYGGPQIADLEESLPELPPQEADDAYSLLIRKLDKNFLPRKNKDYARFKFGNLSQEAGESMANDEDDAIRDHLIKTMNNNRIRVKTIRNNWTLAQILDEAAVEEESTAQANEIDEKLQDTTESHKINYINKGKRERDRSELCHRCGSTHAKGNCKTYGAKCFNCGKRNHYTRMCQNTDSKDRSAGKREKSHRRNDKKEDLPHASRNARPPNGNQNNFRRRRIRHVEREDHPKSPENDYSDSETDSLDEDIERIVQHMNVHRTTQTNAKKNKCKIWINGTTMEVEPETGADTNVMDEHQFNELLRATPGIKLQDTRIKLKTLTEDLPVIGECNVTLENTTRKTQAQIAVIQGKIDSLPLLGRQTLEELGMIKFDANVGLKEPNRDETQTINKVQTGNENLDQILLKFKDRFEGIGKAKRDGEDIAIHLPLKEDAQPIAQKPRRVPYHLMEPLKKRMEEFVDRDIMEKVPEHASITWCSPLVVQPKPKNPNDIRVSLDLRVLNKSMQRTRQVQAPITEDFITTFKDCKVFSKLDMNHGYHQFALDENSRKLMTFSSPWGNYRYKRLAFGGINSQDLFDTEMSKIISGIPRVLNNRDDIMIGGTDWNDHNDNLAALLQRLENHNLTLRKEKCEFGKSTIEFHGHLFTAEGLKPSPNKVKAVRECSPPTSKEELVSFLQMMAYLSRYISNFSSRCEPLRRLTKKEHKFEWTEAQQKAFEDLKTAITTAPVLIPYQPGRDTMVICDGSPTGLGGGLFQKTEHGYQPVHFVSRSLTDTEKRYSQIEREALAAEFTTTRLHMYLLGAQHFQLATDHKPLLPLLNNPNAKLPPRIERIVMKMQNLDFTAIHIPGKSNMTDYLSRHPLPEIQKTNHEKHVRAVIEVDHAVVMETIESATKEDNTLLKLMKALETGKWDRNDPDLTPFFDLSAEMYVSGGVLLRLDRIIPPESLRDKISTVAHKQGHLGISKTKELIRRKYWFPNMNKRIEDIVSSCFSCQVATNTHHTEPAKMTNLPERPWDTVEADFCGPFPNNEYVLVVTDQYSRYPEAEFISSTSIKPVRRKLKKIFATHGIPKTPKTVQTDNGPPFNSQEFKTFAAEMGFKHKKVTPKHPKAQGQVEGFNKLVNKTATIANQEGLEVHEATYDMLQAYRDTPHPATKKTPYELMMNREVRTKLEHFPSATAPQDQDVRSNDQSYKARIKQYHDQRHRATQLNLKVGQAVIVKRDVKRKAQTPYEPHVYLVTKVKGSTIFARRLSDGKAICRDASRVKALKTNTMGTNDEETSKPQSNPVPPAYSTVQTGEATPRDEATGNPARNIQAIPRRSTRRHISVFDRHLRDFEQH
ncbi:hypothetical protein ACROYT_G001867 [Oculina patagonica]